MLKIEVTIREYQDDDWQEVCRVHDRARPLELAGIVAPREVSAMTSVAGSERFFTSQTYVATLTEDNAQIVGFVSIDPPELTWLYVDPDYHRRGVGTVLVRYVLPLLGKDGFLICLAENRGVVRFYESCGFTVAARFPGDAEGHSCWCLRLCLPGSKHRDRPPRPTESALVLAGFSLDRPGRAVRGKDGVWAWQAAD